MKKTFNQLFRIISQLWCGLTSHRAISRSKYVPKVAIRGWQVESQLTLTYRGIADMWIILAACVLGSGGNYYSDENPFRNTDPAKGALDFRLKPGACGIDIGATLPEITEDFDGVKRPQGKGYDIGAYEFTGGPKAPQDLTIKDTI